MAYDENLAARLQQIFARRQDIQERKMFGGLAFLCGGHMCCGVVRDRLMLRVGPAAYEEALGRPHVKPMDFTGRPSKGMIYVEPEGVVADAALRAWVEHAMRFVTTLPSKSSTTTIPTKGKRRPLSERARASASRRGRRR